MYAFFLYTLEFNGVICAKMYMCMECCKCKYQSRSDEGMCIYYYSIVNLSLRWSYIGIQVFSSCRTGVFCQCRPCISYFRNIKCMKQKFLKIHTSSIHAIGIMYT